VNEITLRAPGTDIDALPLGMGQHAIGRVEGGALALIDGADGARVCFCVDRRGVWLAVGQGVRGVHVNGRPVQRKALLRIGDSIHVDGHEIVLASTRPTLVPPRDADAAAAAGPTEADPRVLLRGVGGRHHGRSFTLDRQRLVGSAADADIRIDDPAFAARHARIGLQGGQVVLRGLEGGDSCQVNGESRRDALLQPGDQVVFDAHHRFVVEAPLRVLGPLLDEDTPDAALLALPAGVPTRRLPWLLLAALLLAAALGALLLL
jgi:pSer/pThr/pTyr-binding forkhead associated (FHA) protein